eukprot:4341182-Pyramimonas_sp.AAC.1
MRNQCAVGSAPGHLCPGMMRARCPHQQFPAYRYLVICRPDQWRNSCADLHGEDAGGKTIIARARCRGEVGKIGTGAAQILTPDTPAQLPA